MDDGAFQWDDAKAVRNFAKHKVTFEAARDAFRDPFAVEWEEDSRETGESRFVILGMAENRLLFVDYALRGDIIRLISARRAEPYERRRYHEENQA